MDPVRQLLIRLISGGLSLCYRTFQTSIAENLAMRSVREVFPKNVE